MDKIAVRFFFLIVSFQLVIYWQSNANNIAEVTSNQERDLNIQIVNTKSDTAKINLLNQLAFFYTTIEGNDVRADSLSQAAIEIAERSLNDITILSAYNKYLESVNVRLFNTNAGKIVNKAEKISKQILEPEIIWKTYQNISKYYFKNFEYDKSLDYAYQASAITNSLDNKKYVALSYLLIGRCLEHKNQKIDALRNYLSATNIAEQINDKNLLAESYNIISRFYGFSKMHQKAEEYKRKEFELIKTFEPIDSIAILFALCEFEGVALNASQSELNENNMNFIFNYLERHPNHKLKEESTSLYRTYLVSTKQFNKLHDFYTKRFPEDLIEMKANDYNMYLRIKAFMFETENQIDSALYYLERAAELIAMNPNNSMVANFYLRFGEFYERQNKIDEAIMMYTRSLHASKTTHYIPFSLRASRALENLYAQKADFAKAYKFSGLSAALADSLIRIQKLDELVAMEIDNEANLLEMLNEREKSKTKRRNNIQYTAIVVMLFTAFVILMIMGRYKVKPWVIRTIGFFAFIFAFEFIILIADNVIHHITHGEPWKILLIKIILIGILLPLHHFIEGVVIQYLLDKKKTYANKGITIREFVHKYVLKEDEH